jgi:hypothetical protein
MKIRLAILLWVILGHASLAQPVAQLEAGYWQFPAIDRIFQAYQLAHPWSTSSIQPMGIAAGIGGGWNQALFAPRGLQALGLVHYRYQTTSWNGQYPSLIAGFHQVSAEILLRSHPRCLVKEVQNTGPLGTRWYVQLGSGYAWNLPFARKYGEQVNIHSDEKYRDVSGQFYCTGGTGWHAFTIGTYVLTLESTVGWFPQFSLDGFATAVLGHNESNLAETAKNSLFAQACIRLTRLKKNANWWDRPRSGDKS